MTRAPADHFLSPPDKVDLSFDEVTTQPLWPYGETTAEENQWPLRLCTDEECSKLSGIPERSLLTLQTAEVLKSSKAPIGGGSYRRVWPLAEAAAGAALDAMKRATNIEYRTVAKIAYHASIFTRIAFVDFIQFSRQGEKAVALFGADLVITHNRNIYMVPSEALLRADRILNEAAIRGVIPIAGIDDGEARRVPLPQELARLSPAYTELRERTRNAFDTARFSATVNLKNVFVRFEKEARALRPPAQ